MHSETNGMLRAIAVFVSKHNPPCLLLGLVLASFQPATAAPSGIWTGAAFPDTNWTTAANWSGSMIPTPQSDLLLPDGAAGLTNFNDLATGFIFHSITIGGVDYRISASRPFGIIAGLASTNPAGANTIQAGITLGGPVTISNAAGGTLILNGAIDLSGNDATFANYGNVFVFHSITNSGGITKTGTGTLQLSQANGYDGLMRVLEGRVTILNNLGLGTVAAGTLVGPGAELQILNGRVIAEPLQLAGTLSSGFSASNVWSGPITLVEPGAVVAVNSGGSLQLAGLIDGTNGFRKTQGGELRLAADNPYTGPTIVESGTLSINGSQPGSPVTVAPGGILRGVNGHSGAVSNAPFGTIRPGDPAILATLNIDGGLNCVPFSLVDIRILGGASFDRLNVTGPVILGDAMLQLQLTSVPPPSGAAFELIGNDGTEPVEGTFAGLSEGSLYVVGGVVFQISYTGGDGNDVVLTRISEPSTISAITTTTNGVRQISGIGLPNVAYVLEATPGFDTAPFPWSPIATNVADGFGVYQFIDQDSLLFPTRFYRVVSP